MDFKDGKMKSNQETELDILRRQLWFAGVSSCIQLIILTLILLNCSGCRWAGQDFRREDLRYQDFNKAFEKGLTNAK